MSTIRVGVAPWAHLLPHCFPKSKSGCDPGVELDLLETLFFLMNLTAVLVILPNGDGCGDRSENGSWTGLLKMLQNGEIDMIGNLCNLNKLGQYSDSFFRISWPVWQYRDRFIIQAPKPHPLTFAPFAPFGKRVWLACVITYLLFVCLLTFHTGVHDRVPQKISARILNSAKVLFEICLFRKRLPAQRLWPLFLLFTTVLFTFYNTHIFAGVLYPFPIWKPFSNSDEFVRALLDGRYRLLAHKSPPTAPVDCIGKPCQALFSLAMEKHGYTYMPNSTGHDLLSAITEQGPDASPKLVIVNGRTIINLYLSEFLTERDRLWIIDSGLIVELWAGYVSHRTQFRHGRRLNAALRQLGDYRANILAKYLRLDGKSPHRGDKIVSEMGLFQVISLRRIKGVFCMYIGAVTTSVIIFFLEWIWSRRLHG